MDYVTDAIQKTFVFYFSEAACIIHSVLPFSSDGIQNKIVDQTGIYTSSLGNDSKSSSSISGMYSVTLLTESGDVHLTTAPWCQACFPKGTFEVCMEQKRFHILAHKHQM